MFLGPPASGPHFFPPLQAKSTTGASFSAIFFFYSSRCFWIRNLRRGANWVGSSKKQGFRMVFLAGNSCLYRGPHPHLDVVPWAFYSSQSPSSILLTMIKFLCMVGGAKGADQRKRSPAGSSCWYPACASCCKKNLVEIFWKWRKKICGPKPHYDVKMDGQLCTLLLLCFSTTCLLGKIYEKFFYGVFK